MEISGLSSEHSFSDRVRMGPWAEGPLNYDLCRQRGAEYGGKCHLNSTSSTGLSHYLNLEKEVLSGWELGRGAIDNLVGAQLVLCRRKYKWSLSGVLTVHCCVQPVGGPRGLDVGRTLDAASRGSRRSKHRPHPRYTDIIIGINLQ